MADTPQGITKITVQGFKSLYDETSVEIRPLTLLAGANSSGKSSIMQPLLLMKQTLEAEYEPKVFRLDGANVKYTSPRQFFSLNHDPINQIPKPITVALQLNNEDYLKVVYSLANREEIVIDETTYERTKADKKFQTQNGKGIKSISLKSATFHEDLLQQLPVEMENLRLSLERMSGKGTVLWNVEANRCFLNIGMVFTDSTQAMQGDPLPLAFFPLHEFSHLIQDIIHVPGLRDNPKRNYPIASIEGNFKGTFDNYFASIIAQRRLDEGKNQLLHSLLEQMTTLGLSSGIGTSIRNAEIEISVDHALGSEHTINIADVGLGISQVLPVLVALLVAKPGQLVYLEQPELHLHPRAQTKLAEIIADAAKRGVRVVVETHSSLLLLGVQTLIAENKLNHDDVILHWFKRGEDGKTTVTSVEPDKNGAYGDWPEDFADVELDAQSRYMEAVEKRLLEQQN